jgi:hypothetical protein
MYADKALLRFVQSISVFTTKTIATYTLKSTQYIINASETQRRCLH